MFGLSRQNEGSTSKWKTGGAAQKGGMKAKHVIRGVISVIGPIGLTLALALGLIQIGAVIGHAIWVLVHFW